MHTYRQTDTGHVQHVCVGPDMAPAQAVSIRWTGLVTGLWDWTHRKLLWVTEMTQEMYDFHLPSMRVFSCNTAVISVRISSWSKCIYRDLMLTLEGYMALIIATKLSYTRFCNQAWERCSFLNYFCAATLGDVIILLTIKYGFPYPDWLSDLSLGTTLTNVHGEWWFATQDQCTGVHVYSIAVR